MITTSLLDFDNRILNEAESLSKKYKVKIIGRSFGRSILKTTPFEKKMVKVPRIKFIFTGLMIMKMTQAVFKENADYFHAHDLSGLMIGFFPALLKRKTLLYDSHELWANATLPGIFSIFSFLFGLIEKVLLFKVKKVITVNESLAKILRKRYGKETLVLYNFPKKTKPKKVRPFAELFPGKKLIIYIGGFTRGRALKQIVGAGRYLDNNFRILLIGYGVLEKDLRKEIEKENLTEKVILHSAIPFGQIVPRIRGSELGLCLIEQVSVSYYLSTPNKLFQYISAQVPILGSPFPEIKRIIGKEGIGETVSSFSPEVIAKKIKEMSAKVRQNKYHSNLKKLEQKYVWETEEQKLLDFYEKLD